ncbi:MAG TPA: hypothetical protein VGG17_09085 [Acidimicrobiales bacterium]|jgi:photosystem II stability/assembly factor-like uncharacterized protein
MVNDLGTEIRKLIDVAGPVSAAEAVAFAAATRTDKATLTSLVRRRASRSARRVTGAEGGSSTTSHFPRFPLVLTALTVAAVVALVTGLLIVGSKNAPAPSPSATASGALSFQLVDVIGPSPFRSVSPGATMNLQCVTELVCYSLGASGDDLYQSTDGGQSWVQTAPLPPLTGGTGWSTLSFSCPTVETCAIVEVLIGPISGETLAQFVLTTDGGANWTASAIPTPVGISNLDPSVSRFVCGDATHCLLSVIGSPTASSDAGSNSPSQQVGTFLSTSDAGLTWTQATSVPSAPAGGVWTLNCGTDGSCLAVSALGNSADHYVVGLRSDDWGLTWLAGAPSDSFDDAILYASCGDTTHCMLVPAGSPTTPYEIITTSNAGASWQVSGPPTGWENMPTGVSCANAEDCWIATSTYDTQNTADPYGQPVIEATGDGGITWSSDGLPATTPPISDVVALSCPISGDGCMGIAIPQQPVVPASGTVSPSQSQSGPLVISNLPGLDRNT